MNIPLFKGKLIKSTLISAALHLAAAAVLFSKPLHLHPRFLIQMGKIPLILQEEESITVLKRNKALEEAFSHLDRAPPLRPTFTPSEIAKILREEKLPSFEDSSSLSPAALSFPDFNVDSMPFPLVASLEDKETALTATPSSSNFSPTIAKPSALLIKSCAFSSYVKELPSLPVSLEVPTDFEFIPSKEEVRLVDLPAMKMAVPAISYSLNPSLQVPVQVEVPTKKIHLPFAKTSDFTIKPSQSALIARQDRILALENYGFPSLHLKEWNEFFDIDVKTYPQEGGGFLFSINLVPRQDLADYQLKQNFLFIMDRSNSIDKHRYQAFKRAVTRAISALREGDYFNVLLLDSTITFLSEKPIPFSKSNQQRAEEFLEKQSHGHYGAATDIYSTLTKILGPIEYSEEAVTAILISDGDSPLKPSQQRKKINNWLEANRDRITLYAATAGQGNNLSSLKMLSLASRGFLLYSDTHAAFPRKLAKLVMDLRRPIAKEMTASFIPSDSSARLEMLPPSSRLPYLFSDHPYALMGCCDKLTDFTLILEGKNRDQILTIKKTVSLSKAKPGSRLLARQWASERAHTFFDQYLREGESSLLEKAKKHETIQNREKKR